MSFNFKMNGFETTKGQEERKTKCSIGDIEFEYSFDADPSEMKEAIKGFYSMISEAMPQFVKAVETNKSSVKEEIAALNAASDAAREATKAANDSSRKAETLKEEIRNAKYELEDERFKKNLESINSYKEVEDEN